MGKKAVIMNLRWVLATGTSHCGEVQKKEGKVGVWKGAYREGEGEVSRNVTRERADI